MFAFEARNQGQSDSMPGYEPLQWVTRYEVRDTRAALAYVRSRPDAGQNVHRSLERLSSREQGRARPIPGRFAGESNRQAHCDGRHSRSSNQKKPTVPGPACVPTTAPSVVTSSISA